MLSRPSVGRWRADRLAPIERFLLAIVVASAGIGLPAQTAAADTARPVNDAVTHATVITQAGLPFSATQDSLNATTDTGGIPDPAPTCADGPTGFSVWYRITPRTNVTVRLEVTGGDDFPPAINLYQRQGARLIPGDCAPASSQPVWLHAGTTYYVMLTSYYSGRPAFTFTITAQ
jgi:hypothetical protein